MWIGIALTWTTPKLILVDKNLCDSLISLGENRLLGGALQIDAKIQIWHFWAHPLYEIWE